MKHAAIRGFLAAHYSDERLAALLAHAEDGKLHFDSCCCLVGIATARHPLRGRSVVITAACLLPHGVPGFLMPAHYKAAKELSGAEAAEDAFYFLGNTAEERRKRLIPIIRKEIRAREYIRREATETGKLAPAAS